MAVELVAGAVVKTVFSALYESLKDLIGKNLIFNSLFKNIKSSLASLKPLIDQIAECNMELDFSKKELEDLQQVLEEGKELVGKCSEVAVKNRWNLYKKYKYANKFLGWDESLQRQLQILNVQGIRDGRKMAVELKNMEVTLMNIEKNTSNHSAESTTLDELPLLAAFIVGLDVPLEKLKGKLLTEDGVSMLVVTAPGGCGKTTLATMFCQDQQVKDKFKDNIFFAVVTQNGTLLSVLEQICKRCKVQYPTSSAQEDQRLKACLTKKEPLLLVLDDVWLESDVILEKIQLILDQTNRKELSNLKILVTSRYEFLKFGEPYRLPLLEEDTAMKLFHHTVSLGEEISFDISKYQTEIVKRCNGFPLAINVVGRSLYKQPEEVWEARADDWSKGSSILEDEDTRMLLCLKSSLDALDKNEKLVILKNCFLDLGSFPEDKKIPVEALIDIWAALYDDGVAQCIETLIKLRGRSLANFVDKRKEKIEGERYYNEHFVSQHDLLRELAIYYSKQDSVKNRKRVFIEIRKNKLPKWWKENRKYQSTQLLSISTDSEFSIRWPKMQLPKAEVLVLNFRTQKYALPEFVEEMKELKVLILTKDGFSGAELTNFELLRKLSKIKSIRLEHISRIPSLIKNPIQLKSLEKISVCNCNIFQAFSKGSIKISDAFPNLKEMNIENDLGELPAELCDLVQLKKLSISHCLWFYALPERIGNLVNLEVLRLRSCVELLELPDSMKNLKKLNFLDLSGSYSIKELPKDIGEMSSLTKLDIRCCRRFKELPLSILLDHKQFQEVICDEDTKHLCERFPTDDENLHRGKPKLSHSSIKDGYLRFDFRIDRCSDLPESIVL